MPVYNVVDYLSESINSILSQTLADFEYIIIDDGSTDGTTDLLRSFNDPRIKAVFHTTNAGITQRLNEGLHMANGQYIARMDGDDVAMPTRFEKQVTLLEQQPAIGLCGSFVNFFGAYSGPGWVTETNHERIRVGLLFNNMLCHSSVMLRGALIRHHRIRYSNVYPAAEDYALWVRLSKLTRFAVIPEALVHYRVHDRQVSTNQRTRQLFSRIQIVSEQLQQMGIHFDSDKHELHTRLVLQPNDLLTHHTPANVRAWLNQICRANRQAGYVDPVILDEYLANWCVACRLPAKILHSRFSERINAWFSPIS